MVSILPECRVLGNTGVDIFFGISGFLLYGIVLEKRQNYRQYLKRRIHRLYPTFLVVLAIYVGISVVIPQYSKLPHSIYQAVIYVAENVCMLPGIFNITPIITVSWSLSYELFFYLTIPLGFSFLGMCRLSSKQRLYFWLSLFTVLTFWPSITC